MIVDVRSFHSVVALFTIITTIFVNGSNHACSTTRSCIKQNVLLGVSKQYACLKRSTNILVDSSPTQIQWNRNALDFDLHLIPPRRGPSLSRQATTIFLDLVYGLFLRSIVTNGILISVNREVISPTYVVQYCIFYFNHRARGCRCYTQLQMLKEPCVYEICKKVVFLCACLPCSAWGF